MQISSAIVLLLLVWSAKGLPTSEPSDSEEEEEELVAELARRLQPLESLESKQRRLEELEARQNMVSNLEASHRSLEGGHGCGGGCSRPKVVDDLEAQYVRDLHPRPIFGLLNEILETARFGYKLDRPRPHLLF